MYVNPVDPYQQYQQQLQDLQLGIRRPYNPRARSAQGVPLAGNIDLGPAIEGPVSGGTRRTMRMPNSMEEIGEAYQQAKAGLREAVLQPGGVFKNQAGNYRGALGGKSSALVGAFGTAMEDPIAGVASVIPGVIAGGAANMLTTELTKNLIKGPPAAKAAGMALRYLAPGFVGGGVQQASARAIQGITGSAPSVGSVPNQSGGGLFGIGTSLQDLEIPVPFIGNVAIGERAQRKREAAYGREELRKDAELQFQLNERMAGLQMRNDLQFAQAMGQIQNQNNINQTKALAPIIADAQRRELAGQQALLNTQGAIYQRMGRMAGIFELAGRGMAESGALARTMAANSPYNAAILPAPQISFG
jgi:hypothetical protein